MQLPAGEQPILLTSSLTIQGRIFLLSLLVLGHETYLHHHEPECNATFFLVSLKEIQ